jgi:hypothetical protein
MSSAVAASHAAVSLSPARAAASRRNGAKSRGPKTPEGKARSAQNALKHGLCAQQCVVLPGERASAFAALEAALLEELAPEGALQAVLAQRVVAASWRLARAERLEAELFTREMHGPCGDRGLGLALIRDCNGARAFDTLLRYRGGTLAELWRALRTLKALQAEAAAPQAEVGASAPRLLPEPRKMPIEPEARTDPGDCAPPQAASEPALPPAASVPAVIPCDRLAAPTKLPDEPERRGIFDGSGRPSDRAKPRQGEARPADPARPPLPIELPERGSAASLLAGTALVPPARRRWP